VCDPKAKSDLDSASTMATISTLGFGAAGVGVVCGVVGLLLPRTNVETALHSEQEHVGVWFAPGSAGLRGSF
jgi:hypothetical protein